MKKISSVISALGAILAALSAICIFLLDAENEYIFKNILVCVAIFIFGSIVCFIFYDTKRTTAILLTAFVGAVHIWFRIHRNLIILGAAAEEYKLSSSTSEREFIERTYHRAMNYSRKYEDTEYEFKD